MGKRFVLTLAVLALAPGCAHKALSGNTLDRVVHPAFISRIEEQAGPKSWVFRDDGSYGGKLKKLEAKEADRRLTVKLGKGMTRFEISDGIRSKTLALLPQERPWTQPVDPAQVAFALQSFLVEEVPANAPDYDLLKPLGADAVVEFVVEDYGMRSKNGRAGTYIEGYGRMFFLDGGGDVWRRSFRADQVDSLSPHVDPFRVAKDPVMFRTELTTLLDAVATQFAKDLNPPDRNVGPPPQNADGELPLPEEGGKAPGEKKVPVDNELPAPDPI
ncbi:MAG: hypothetical protein ACYC8T_17335 [Myxococcaceae bacterium]